MGRGEDLDLAVPLRDPVSPETLLEELREELALVAATSRAQLAWCKSGQILVPVDEIPQSLDQVAFTHRPRIREAGLLTAAADARIDELLQHFQEMRNLEKPALWQDDGLDEPEWSVARHKAEQALSEL